MKKKMVHAIANIKAIDQPSGGVGRSATRQTASVTEAKSCRPKTKCGPPRRIVARVVVDRQCEAAHPSNSGFGLRIFARYEVRGLMFSSASM